jgi:hypothetical protein
VVLGILTEDEICQIWSGDRRDFVPNDLLDNVANGDSSSQDKSSSENLKG